MSKYKIEWKNLIEKAKKEKIAFHNLSEDFSRSQEVIKCENCNDTAFVLQVGKRMTNRCCRCGERFE